MRMWCGCLGGRCGLYSLVCVDEPSVLRLDWSILGFCYGVQAGENDGEFLVSGCQAGAGRFYVVWSVEVVCDPEGSRRMCGRRLLASVGEVRSWMVWSSVSAWVIAVSNSCFDFGCTSWQ